MRCRFCDTEKVKLCKAHLIPESFYRFMYPDGKVDSKTPLVKILHNKNYTIRDNIGVYDDNILCDKCDSFLGNYDNYGATILLSSVPELIHKNDIEIYLLSGIDVAKLKLFFLSVLWRCSISERLEVKHISLGFKFEQRLKEMLIAANAGDVNEFSVIIHKFNYVDKKSSLDKLLILPTYYKLEGINYVQVYFSNGYKVMIKVDSRVQHKKILPLSLALDNPVYVFKSEYFEETEEYLKITKQVSAFPKRTNPHQ